VSTLEALRLDGASVRSLVRQSDPLGVLSIYAGAALGKHEPGPRGAEIDIKNRLVQLERCIRSDGTPERSRALRDLLHRLEPEIERLVDPSRPGRGRSLRRAQ
jgi:hypothetical protein